MIRVLDVCSGYSASTLAWTGLPFCHVGYAEIDAFPRAVLEQRHGATPVDWDHRWTEGSNTTPLFGDFTKIEAHHVGPVDLLTGGTPCQSFSVAGKRLGLDDPRGNLTLEFLALARRLRVEWLVWENVPGFLSHDEGRTMGAFLGLLAECGYGAAWRVLDAQFIRVDGYERAVPQRRRRVFVVGHLGDAAGPAAVLFERESLCGHPAPRREQGQGTAPTLSARTKGGGGLGTDFDCDGGLVPQGCGGETAPTLNAAFGSKLGLDNQHIDSGAGLFVAQPIAPTMRVEGDAHTGFALGDALVAHSLRADGFDASEDGTGRGTPLVPVAHPIAFMSNESMSSGDNQNIAPTLRIGSGGQGQAVAAAIPVGQAWAVRRLTPTECARLMGVPDDFLRITYRGKPAADGPMYKALGNSQATNVMRWIGHGLADAIAAQRGHAIAYERGEAA